MEILLSFLNFLVLFRHIQTESLKQRILNSLLASTTYDKRIPPGIDYGGINEERPTNVSVQLLITQIYEVNVNEMDLSVSCYLRQKWFDHRLKFNYPNITLQLAQDDIKQIWTPDTFFPESKDGKVHDVTTRNTVMYIYHNGTVIYSLKLNIKLGCRMDFRLYPLDVQTCKFRLESYGYTSNELLYSWFENSPVNIISQNLPLYNIPSKPETTVKTCGASLGTQAFGFSCLEMSIQLHRAIGYYMTEVFIPDILIVSLSWVTFWLHPLAVPARVSLGAVTVLTMSSQGSASRRNAPRVSYVKAVDVWTLLQILFVFSAMVEFSVVNFLARKKISEEESVKLSSSQYRETSLSYLSLVSEKAASKTSKYRESQGDAMDPDMDESRRPFLSYAKKIDYVCRIAFPAVYAFFIFMFWMIVANI